MDYEQRHTELEKERVESHRVYRDAMKIVDNLKALVTIDPGRPFQQWIYDVHEEIYNTTGVNPERADQELVPNDEYHNAIMRIYERIEDV